MKMISWLKSIFSKKAVDENLKKVLFNIVTMGGIIGGSFAILISIFIGLPKVQIVAIAFALVILVLGLYLANCKDKVNVGAFLIVSVITLVLFPVMFYTDGGIYGGMGYWFAIGIIFNFLLVEGSLFYILLILQFVMTFCCFVDAYMHPNHIILLETTGDVFIDTVQSLLIISLVIGIIVRFQNKVYKEKLEELDRSEKKANEAAAEAMEAGNAKSRFLAQMSHEIRTPINAVLGMNEMILRESSEKSIQEYAEHIDSAGKTLLSLINSILDFSKIEDGNMEIVPVKYDMASFINDLYHSIIHRANAKGLTFVMNVDAHLPCTLIGDDVRLSQVIMNLLTNAVKYTEKGSVTLTIREDSRQNDKVRILVSVEDTGIGIKEEDKEKLFESFERLDEVRNHNIEGTGLGICIVTNFLKMMESKLSVESTYGQGSTFSFVIEQEIADAAPIGDYEKRLKESNAHKDKEELLCVPGAKVLVVDDNDMNLKVARNLLKLCAIKPDEAASGLETIDLMRRNTYDIVFLDHMMPKMDGIETLNRLKEESLISNSTVMIVLTANAVVGAREKYLEAGFADYLSKPLEIKHLVEKLEKYLPESAYRTEGRPEFSKDSETLWEKPADADTTKDEIMEFEPDDEIMEFEPDDAGGVFEFEPVAKKNSTSLENENRRDRYSLNGLRNGGIDVKAGLRYCADDASLYFELLDDFISSCEGRLEDFNLKFQDESWHDYEVAVHALKSNARMIGMNEIYEMARKLEEAAREKNIEFVKKSHGTLLACVRKAIICIAENNIPQP